MATKKVICISRSCHLNALSVSVPSLLETQLLDFLDYLRITRLLENFDSQLTSFAFNTSNSEFVSTRWMSSVVLVNTIAAWTFQVPSGEGNTTALA